MWLLRSSVGLKTFLTVGVAVCLGLVTWVIDQNLMRRQRDETIKVRNLEKQLFLQDQVLDEYQKLVSQQKQLVQKNLDMKEAAVEGYDYLLNLAQQAGLSLQAMTSNSIELTGEYQALQFFLKKLATSPRSFDCQELKILQNDDRLQITYVYGIHTLVSK